MKCKGLFFMTKRIITEGAIHFALAYDTISRYRLKPVSKENAWSAGVHKMGVLRAYDTLVDNSEIKLNFLDKHIQTFPAFKDMSYHALEECHKFALLLNMGKVK